MEVRRIDWAYVEQKRWIQRITKRKLAEVTGIQYRTLLSTMLGRTEAPVKVEKILEALGISYDEALLPEGILKMQEQLAQQARAGRGEQHQHLERTPENAKRVYEEARKKHMEILRKRLAKGGLKIDEDQLNRLGERDAQGEEVHSGGDTQLRETGAATDDRGRVEETVAFEGMPGVGPGEGGDQELDGENEVGGTDIAAMVNRSTGFDSKGNE